MQEYDRSSRTLLWKEFGNCALKIEERVKVRVRVKPRAEGRVCCIVVLRRVLRTLLFGWKLQKGLTV